MAQVEFITGSGQRRGGTGLVQVVRNGFKAFDVGTRKMTRRFDREESQQQRFYLEVVFLLLVIGAIVWYSIPAGAPAPEPNAIQGHLGTAGSSEDISTTVDAGPVHTIEASALGKLLDFNRAEDLLRRVRFNRAKRAGIAGEAELFVPGADGLWKGEFYGVGDEVTVGDSTHKVARIDDYLVVLQDEDGALLPVFNPRFWTKVQTAYQIMDGRPFSNGLLEQAIDGFWTVRTGTRSLYDVTLVAEDGSRIPDAVFATFVDDLERVMIEWRTSDTSETFRDRVERWLASDGPRGVMLMPPRH